MKKQAFGMVAALFLFVVLLPVGAYASDVYAILYEDGTLVFQNNETPETGRAVKETYEVDLTVDYRSADSVPWLDCKGFIRVVSFADKVSPTATTHWFYKCQNLERVDNIGNLDTSNVTDMSYMFYLCSGLTSLDVSHFDTANVIGMIAMFYDCIGLTSLDVSCWDTSNVTSMERMFLGCRKLTTLDLSHFDTAKVKSMSRMFMDCRGLTTLDLSSFHLAESVDVAGMFKGCSGLTELDLSSFGTNGSNKVWRIPGLNGLSWMFENCTSLKTIYAAMEFPFGLKSESTFQNCTSLVGGNGTKYDESHTNGGYARIDTPSAPGYFTYKAAPVAYAITNAVTENGNLSVTLSNPGAATLAVAYFDASGKFVSVNLQDVQANAGTAESSVPANAKVARVMLLDDDFRPLCAARSVTI